MTDYFMVPLPFLDRTRTAVMRRRRLYDRGSRPSTEPDYGRKPPGSSASFGSG
ncbi:hypothetical protein WBG79_00035 [Prosthecomicrobium sp. N25]